MTLRSHTRDGGLALRSRRACSAGYPRYLAGTPFSGFESSGVVPAATASLRDLEFLVGLSEPDAAQLVNDHAHPGGEGGRFGGAFSDDERERRNPILHEAWSQFDFLRAMDEGTADSGK